MRIAPRADGVSIWSSDLFGEPAGSHLREFLSRVFSVSEVATVEIRRAESFGRVRYDSSANPPEVWLKLSRALGQFGASHPSPEADDAVLKPLGVESLYLDGPPELPIRVGRVGSSLSTWRLRYQSDHRIRLTHPILLNRKDVAYRLEEELTAILGVEEFRTSTLTSSVAVRFNPALLNPERLIRQLEKSWPRLLEGLEGPPSAARLVAASGLLGLAFTGQYLVPRLKPLALLGVAAYGAANVKNAAKQLAQWEVGLPTLYSVGLAFTLLSGMPFSSSVMAVFMQFWPRLAYQTMTRSQRRLFAVHRQRATWARLVRDGEEIEVDLDALTAGDVIEVGEGETIPVDGVVTEGLAAVDEEALSGRAGAADKTPGDAVYASTFVRHGRLKVRVEKIGSDTVAGYIGSLLPHSKIDNLLSSAEAERIANRNARRALALAGANLVLRRRLRSSQAVVRPDYVTAPRLGAQLGALHDLADGLRRGIFFRDPTALDRLPATDVYVFDETAALERMQLEVADIFPARDVSVEAVLGYATAAFPAGQNERARALQTRSVELRAPIPAIFQRSRYAGAIRYLDSGNRLIEIAAPAYLAAVGVKVPAQLAETVAASPYAHNPRRAGGGNKFVAHEEPFLRPLWVLRDGEVLGAVTFRREGAPEGIKIIADLQARNRRARFVYLSSQAQAAAAAVAGRFGFSSAFGGLDADDKARAITRLGNRTIWIGDGASPEAIPSIEASTVSVSVAGVATAPRDAADIVLLQPGLDNLVPLRSIGRDHRTRIQADYRTVYTANLLSVAGGLFAGFGSLEAGLTSNAGTAYVYLRHRRHLRDLISQVETKRAILKSPAREESEHTADALHAGLDAAEEFVAYREIDRSAELERGLHHGV
ncbi:MAG: ATPase [Candidatus Binatus sp.]